MAAGQRVMCLSEIYTRQMEPASFVISHRDTPKRNIGEDNYFNLGYFTSLDNGATIPVGNLVINGEVKAQAKGQAAWMNTKGRALTTVFIYKNGKLKMDKADSFHKEKNLNFAVSGIPIIRRGERVSMGEIKEEGYLENECRSTWHGFLGIRYDRLVYAAAECGYEKMYEIMEMLGVNDAIKLDGGGSFILVNKRVELKGTEENRRINNIGVWSE